MQKAGYEFLVNPEYHSKILTCYKLPVNISFEELHNKLYNLGVTIYPGKLSEFNSFRVANIGEINKADIDFFLDNLIS